MILWTLCREFSGVASHAKHGGIKNKYIKIPSMDRLEASKSNNQAIGCLEIVTFVASDLL